MIGSAFARLPDPKEERSVGDLKHYQDKDGHVFSMTEADAKLLGYAPSDIAMARERQRAADEAAQAKKDAQASRGAPAGGQSR